MCLEVDNGVYCICNTNQCASALVTFDHERDLNNVIRTPYFNGCCSTSCHDWASLAVRRALSDMSMIVKMEIGAFTNSRDALGQRLG